MAIFLILIVTERRKRLPTEVQEGTCRWIQMPRRRNCNFTFILSISYLDLIKWTI